MTAARRLAAILAAVVGYSRLMGEDEAGTARRCGKRRFVPRPVSTPPCGPSRTRLIVSASSPIY